MPRFEVLCPAAPPGRPEEVTLRLDAEHWLAALKAGLQRTGAPAAPANVLCDVQADGSIHVCDPRGGGVFRIRELPVGAAPPLPAFPPRAARSGGGGASAEEVLAELFERAGELVRRGRQGGLELALDLALEKTGAEAGSILLAEPGGRVLRFVVARGPRAAELLALRPAVPVGVGIAGFCVQEDVCLAVSDAASDPRFYRAISEAIGYDTRSLLCAPIARQGQVLGALELLNKRGGAPFGQADLAVVSYLAHQAARVV